MRGRDAHGHVPGVDAHLEPTKRKIQSKIQFEFKSTIFVDS